MSPNTLRRTSTYESTENVTLELRGPVNSDAPPKLQLHAENVGLIFYYTPGRRNTLGQIEECDIEAVLTRQNTFFSNPSEMDQIASFPAGYDISPFVSRQYWKPWREQILAYLNSLPPEKGEGND